MFIFNRRTVLGAALLLVALLALAMLVSHFTAVEPISRTDNPNGASVQFMADRSRILLPDDCVNVSWQVEGVREVYLNGAGVVGSGQQNVCGAGKVPPTLRIILPDDSAYSYRLPIESMAFRAESWLWIAASVGLLLLAAFAFTGCTLTKRLRLLTAAALLLGTITAAITLLVGPLIGAHQVITDTTIGDEGTTQVYFRAVPNWVVPIGACARLEWAVEGVQAVLLNDVGVLGAEVRERCGGTNPLETLKVEVAGVQGRYPFDISVSAFWYAENFLLFALGILMTAAALDLIRAKNSSPSPLPVNGEGLNRRREWLIVLGVVMVGGVLFYPVVYNGVFNIPGDFRNHGFRIEMMNEYGLTYLPHFLLHMLGALVLKLLPVTNSWAIVIVIHSFYLLLLLTLYWFLRVIFGRPASTKIALAYGVLSLLLMFVAPITILSWSEQRLYRPYINAHVYHNPTSVIVKPFALLLMAYAVYTLRPAQYIRQTAVLPAAAIILATIAKPNYTMCLLPALLIVAVWRRLRGKAMNEYVLIAGFLIPGVSTLGWQYFLSQGSNQAGGSILFDPLTVATIRLSGLQPEVFWLPAALLFSCLFPLCVTLVYRRQAASDTWLKLSWLVFIIALGFYYLLAEGGWRLSHGNFVWGAQTAILVLFAAALAFFVAQNPSLLRFKRPPLTRGFVFCTIVLALHVVSGIVYYLNYAAFDRAWYY